MQTPSIAPAGIFGCLSAPRTRLEPLGHSVPYIVLGYNRLIDYVRIHGQRRLTETLNKDSLVRQKEYPTESSSKSRESVYRNKCPTF
ncbi:hypothetical protein Taro_047382 [Colocasia esculenta]|uniref:Uncharacterized protein n=1 Tax=Colocasia esculenta TaxID=4460 RepID=A0A843WV81_COLES|nr:hypothetical protein [Colocasia esculenta]